METINFDDFETSGDVFAAVTAIVQKKLEIIKDLAKYDEDFGVVVPELEALLAFLPSQQTILEELVQRARSGQISIETYLGVGRMIVAPLEHIVEGHNDRQRRLAGKTDS